jgi:RsiW-degrading membrane proteinase PrsW (M82 family)
VLYLVIGALAVGTAGLAYYLYQDQQKRPGIEINIDKRGIDIKKN